MLPAASRATSHHKYPSKVNKDWSLIPKTTFTVLQYNIALLYWSLENHVQEIILEVVILKFPDLKPFKQNKKVFQ